MLSDAAPTIAQLSQAMVQATAPAFILGAQASFISLTFSRMNAIIDRSRSIHAIPPEAPGVSTSRSTCRASSGGRGCSRSPSASPSPAPW